MAALGRKLTLPVGAFAEGQAFAQVTLGDEVTYHVGDIITELYPRTFARPADLYIAAHHAVDDSVCRGLTVCYHGLRILLQAGAGCLSAADALWSSSAIQWP